MHSCVAYTRKIFKLNPRHVCRLVDIFASRWKWVSSVSDSVRFAFPAHVISLFASKGIEIHNSYQYFPSPPRPPLPSFLSPFFTPFFFFFLPSSDACKSAYCHPFEYVRLIETRRGTSPHWNSFLEIHISSCLCASCHTRGINTTRVAISFWPTNDKTIYFQTFFLSS